MNYIYSNTLQFTLNSRLIQRRIVLISHNPTLLAVQALRCLLSFSTQRALQDCFQNQAIHYLDLEKLRTVWSFQKAGPYCYFAIDTTSLFF